jgi:hypothetical protein
MESFSDGFFLLTVMQEHPVHYLLPHGKAWIPYRHHGIEDLVFAAYAF